MPSRLLSLFSALGLCLSAQAADPPITKIVVRMIVAVDRSLELDGSKVRLPGRVPAGDAPRTLNTVGLPGRWF